MVDFAALLERMIAEAEDPSHRREFVFELARATLRRQLQRHARTLAPAEAAAHMAALEAAIATCAAVASRTPPASLVEGDPPMSHAAAADIADGVAAAWSGPPRTNSRSGRGRLSVDGEAILAFPEPMPLLPFTVEPIAAVAGPGLLPRRRRRSARRWGELAVAAVVPLLVYAAVVPRDGAGQPEVVETIADRPPPTAEPQRRDAGQIGPELAAARSGTTGVEAASDPSHSALPTLPTLYGVYAVQGAQFTELEQVQASPVDPRVRTVLQIKTPTKTLLPDRDLRFLVFRREMMSSAPERVPVRIAARLAKVMTFDPSGKVVIAPPGEERWVIRETGFEFRVRPMRGNPEMIWVQPEHPGSPIPAGRYVMMINGTPYDFTVEGSVTEPAHCLESVGTSRGPTLYECQPK